MRKLLSLILLSTLFTTASCSVETVLKGLLLPSSISIPVLTEHRLISNSMFSLTFNQEVELRELRINQEKISTPSGHSTTFYFYFPVSLELGESIAVSILAMATNGSVMRASINFNGVNMNVPELLLNEISIKGTASNPDRIEIAVLSDGNMAGVTVQDGVSGQEKHIYTFSPLEVKRNDLIVLYWDHTTEERVYERSYADTYYRAAKSSYTLSGTEGAIIITDGNDVILDAFIYMTDGSGSYSGFTSEKMETAFTELESNEDWLGEPMLSSKVTSSRVFARLPGYIDSNSKDDWFITAARKSTFGDVNTYSPYVED